MLKLIPTIFALCLCVALTTATSPARAADDAKAKDKITLPAFHKQTVKLDGKDVPIEVRWFDKPFAVGATDIEKLPESAMKSWISAYQALADGKDDAYVSKFLDAKEARKYAHAIRLATKGKPEKHQEFVQRVRAANVVGEVRVGSYELVVNTLHGNEGNLKIGFSTRVDGYYQLINDALNQKHIDRVMDVSGLIWRGKLAPNRPRKDKMFK